nr:hypothetical protein [uncultured Acetobacteroides sp.]
MEISEVSQKAIYRRKNPRKPKSNYAAAGTGNTNMSKGSIPCLFEMFGCNIAGSRNKTESIQSH